MRRGGIFVDTENLMRCGGWNIRFDPGEKRSDIFLHITDFDEPVDHEEFARLKTCEEIVEFTLVESDEGDVQGKHAVVLE